MAGLVQVCDIDDNVGCVDRVRRKLVRLRTIVKDLCRIC